uniref:Uncharacterized protein n=1 Tax=Anguilla anguilla TaxID=7936 RepID=A0A0E9UTQ7_ANGAN
MHIVYVSHHSSEHSFQNSEIRLCSILALPIHSFFL